ncbi:hypothetical protein PENTCL1PPCAC_14200, partial [Pristionchus entomophagus]
QDRDCLVCGVTTRIAHLGIECCRACAVFYRRAKRGNDFLCRASTGKCKPGRGSLFLKDHINLPRSGLNCKRCRYDHIISLLEKSGALSDVQAEADKADDVPLSNAVETQSSSVRPLLTHVKAHYDTMCFSRLSCELNSRRDPPHPLEISLETGPFFMADFAGLSGAIRILLTSALEFGRATFPEYAGLEKEEKWKLALNFFYRFRMFEGCYRANKIFSNESNKFFVSFATYFTVPFDMKVFETAPEGSNIAGAFEFMVNGDLPRRLKSARDLVARVSPSEEELLAVAVLMFWKTGDITVSDDIRAIGERYRAEVLKELHAYYRAEMKLEDYASRLGELMMLMQVFEKTEDIKVHFEVLRLFNVMTEDNFIYQLQRDLNIS